MWSFTQTARPVLLVTSDELGWDAVRNVAQELVGPGSVAEAQTPPEAIRLASERRPGLVLLSCAFDETTLPPLVLAMHQLLPDSSIVLIGSWTSAMAAAVEAQAAPTGWITWEDLTTTVLHHVLLLAITGRFAISSRSTAHAGRESSQQAEQPLGALAQLTGREITVLQELGHGLTARQIAMKHGYSLRTIRRLITSLEHKLSAHTSFMLGVRASQLGIAH